MDAPTTTARNGDTPDFDWSVYADATFAGLSVLIPVPLIDLFFESVFARRMPRAIATRRGLVLDPWTIRELNRGRFSLLGCLFFPVWLVLMFLKRLFRTVLYFLTIKDATDSLSHHWHRAFLIDHALRRGDLTDAQRAGVAVQTIRRLLGELTTSPVTKLAEQVIGGVQHVLRTVLRWLRQGIEDEVARAAQDRLGQSWADLRTYFDGVAQAYDTRFEALRTAPSSEAGGPGPPGSRPD